jgi:hypothetical protein
VKGEDLEEACHLVPISAVIASGLTPQLWVDVCNQMGEAERMRFYESYMFELIQRVQEGGTVAERLLPRDEDITVSHGIAISGRRGYATHATHVGIVDAYIKRLARWRLVEAATGRAASLPGDTNEGYSEIIQMIKSLLIASRPM